jgi:hypothetical protein
MWLDFNRQNHQQLFMKCHLYVCSRHTEAYHETQCNYCSKLTPEIASLCEFKAIKCTWTAAYTICVDTNLYTFYYRTKLFHEWPLCDTNSGHIQICVQHNLTTIHSAYKWPQTQPNKLKYFKLFQCVSWYSFGLQHLFYCSHHAG